MTEQEQKDLTPNWADEAEISNEPTAPVLPANEVGVSEPTVPMPSAPFLVQSAIPPTVASFHPAPLLQKLIPFLLAGTLLVMDQLSKQFIIANLEVYESMTPIPALASLFRFTHIHNTGAAFGMFPTGSLFFTLIAFVVAIAIVVYTRRLDAGHYLLRIALGMQLGGALGNLVDRLRLGYVTDFIDVIPFPAIFNIADASIVGGVVVLFYLMLLETFEEQRLKKQNPPLAGNGGSRAVTPEPTSEDNSSPTFTERQPYASVND
ncbi:MAG: signal peptidase II [Chloroflexi bacterium]|nr:signal peptidase II [Chloroflexota bacterium]MBP8057394.1 signal peptidase II [Chloroflexota bacterium]